MRLPGTRARAAQAAGALLLTTVLVGCGSDEPAAADADLAGQEATAATAISSYWVDAGVAAEASDCLGEEMVRAFGVDHLQDIGVLNAELEAQDAVAEAFGSSVDAPKAATLIVDCVGLETLMRQQEGDIDDTQAACLAAAFGRDRMVETLRAQLAGDPAEPTPADVETAMGACLAP
jgi:hypothetical protein